MLKLIHKFQKTIVVYIVIFILCASMLIFGVDAMAPQRNPYAVKVDDLEISFTEFNDQKRMVEQRYAAQLGQNAQQLGQLIDAGILKPTQEALEVVVPQAIIQREVAEDGYVASPIEVKKELEKNFTEESYKAFLRNTGRSAVTFERDLAKSLRSRQFTQFISDMAFPAKMEIENYVKEKETTRDLSFVSFDEEDFKNSVGEISKDKQEEYYIEFSEEFETPDMISYNYLVINPNDVESEVEVVDEDIELYYSDHEESYKEPAKAKIRQILVATNIGMNEDVQSSKKSLAEEAQGKAIAGEDFATLAQQYSDDVNTNMIGGDMGWITKGELDEDLEKAIFGLEGPGITSLVKTGEGFHVVKVEEYTAEKTKPISEVRDEIKNIIIKREAPAYAAIVAQDLYDQWSESGVALKEFAKDKPYKVAEFSLASKEKDPRPALKGLTGYMLQTPDEKLQYVERGDAAVIAEITEYQERTIPEMESVKDRLIELIKTSEAKKLAKEKAEEFHKFAAENSFEEAAKKFDVKVEESKDLKVNAALPPVLQSEEASNFVKNAWKAGLVSNVIDRGNVFSVISVKEVKIPEVEEDKIDQTFAQLKLELSNDLTNAFVNQRKSEIEIDIDAGLLSQ